MAKAQQMMHDLFLLAFILAAPLALIAIHQKFNHISFLSPIVLCYALGILLGNLGFINVSEHFFSTSAQIVVPLAIPLLLITTDFKEWAIHARPAIKSMALSIVGVTLAGITTFFLLHNFVPESLVTMGMITGSLIGTNVNLSAIGIALHADAKTFLLVNSADVISGAVFLLFLVSLAKPLYAKILKPYPYHETRKEEKIFSESEKSPFKWWEGLQSLLISALIVLFAAGLSYLFKKRIEEGFMIISISILSILLASASQKIRNLKSSEHLGQYLLLVFGLLIGLKADFASIFQDSIGILIMATVYYWLSAFFQVLLSFIFKIDVDTTIMTTTGTIFGPVFVGQVASAINNRSVMLTGMVTAIFGYAIGNIFGLGMVAFLSWADSLL